MNNVNMKEKLALDSLSSDCFQVWQWEVMSQINNEEADLNTSDSPVIKIARKFGTISWVPELAKQFYKMRERRGRSIEDKLLHRRQYR